MKSIRLDNGDKVRFVDRGPLSMRGHPRTHPVPARDHHL